MRRNFFAALALLALSLVLPVQASAQTDQGYYVGAIPKVGITSLGTAPAVITVSASGATQALSYPTYGSITYDITLTANCTLSIANTPIVGQKQSINVVIRNPAGGYTVTFPTGVEWNNAAVPTVVTTAGTIINYTFESTDGGATTLAR